MRSWMGSQGSTKQHILWDLRGSKKPRRAAGARGVSPTTKMLRTQNPKSPPTSASTSATLAGINTEVSELDTGHLTDAHNPIGPWLPSLTSVNSLHRARIRNGPVAAEMK